MRRMTYRTRAFSLLLALLFLGGVALAAESPNIRLSVRDVPVAQLLQRLMFDSGRQILISGNVDKKISLQLEGQSLDQAMQLIAEETGLHVYKKGQVWVVSDQPEEEKLLSSNSAPGGASSVVIPPPPPVTSSEGQTVSLAGQPLKWEKLTLKFADVYEVGRLLGAYVPESPWERMQLQQAIRPPGLTRVGGYGAGSEGGGATSSRSPTNPYSPLTGGYHQRPYDAYGGAYGQQYPGVGYGQQYPGVAYGQQYPGVGYGQQFPVGQVGYPYGAPGVGLQGIMSMMVFPPDNSLIVQGTQEGIDRIRELLALVDTEPVLLEVTVQLVEIQLDAEEELGISWSPITSGDTEITFGTAAPQPGIGTTTIRYAQGNFWARLGALLSKRKARIVQSPRIVCKSSPTIQPQVSVNTPQVAWIPETSYTQFGTPVIIYTPEVIDIPITLSLYPRVVGDGSINVILSPTFTEFAGYSPPPPTGGAGVPLTITRSIVADFKIANGDTVIIGGVVRRNDTAVWYEVPLLKDLPLIGSLFRSKSTTSSENELVILVTPRILHTPSSVL